MQGLVCLNTQVCLYYSALKKKHLGLFFLSIRPLKFRNWPWLHHTYSQFQTNARDLKWRIFPKKENLLLHLPLTPCSGTGMHQSATVLPTPLSLGVMSPKSVQCRDNCPPWWQQAASGRLHIPALPPEFCPISEPHNWLRSSSCHPLRT